MHLQLHDQTCLQGGEFLGRSAWMWFRLHLPSLTPGFEIAFDGGPGDSKQPDDIFTPISLIDGTKNTFSQIGRIRFHRFTPLNACLLLAFFLSFYHWLKNFANRCRRVVSAELASKRPRNFERIEKSKPGSAKSRD